MMTLLGNRNCTMRTIMCVTAGIGVGIFLSYGLLVNNMSQLTIMRNYSCTGIQKNTNTSTNPVDISGTIGNIQKDALSVVSALKEKNRLLCWVMTAPTREEHRAAIMETWGKRCHLTLFMVGGKEMLLFDTLFGDNDTNSTTPPSSLPPNRRHKIAPNAYIVYLDMGDDVPVNLWNKTRTANLYIHEHFRDSYDWVLKVDDDSFVIIENLHLFLQNVNPNDPLYYGYQFKVIGPAGFVSGGPGYIMSWVNAEKLAAMLTSPDPVPECHNGTGAEDTWVSFCLFKAGIRPGDTRDEAGRVRFSPFVPEMVINTEVIQGPHNWFWEYSTHKLQKGFDCCSDAAISFHYITPMMIRTMEYLIYYVHPFSKREIWNRGLTYEDKTTSDDVGLKILADKAEE